MAKSKEQGRPIRIDVENCVRCGGNHSVLEFAAFKRLTRFARYTHWALCPRTKEPILMHRLTRFARYTHWALCPRTKEPILMHRIDCF